MMEYHFINNNMKKFISFSGGVESSTMCVLFGNKANAIFADTGFEHKEIYERIDLVQEIVRKLHNNNFTIHKVKREGNTLPEQILEGKFYPSFKSRFCTRQFKIEPIDNYLKNFINEGAEIMIGLNVDEAEKRTGNHGNLEFIKYSYPLVENGINREMCKLILIKAGLMPTFPPYMKRGGCIGCYYKSKNEYTAMALINQKEFEIVENLENSIQDKRDKMFTIIQNHSMKQIRENAEQSLFDFTEMYAVINDATNCGVFCNR